MTDSEPDHLTEGEIAGITGKSLLEPDEFSEYTSLVNALTAVVRDADAAFQRIGGSSRHWVRDCFLPLLNRAGLTVVRAGAKEPSCE